ncbi:MAG: YbjQ family protein [Proteobacteria bacterium]|nr:YbjQ family protein [Pseudomonadota bacterium]
MLGYIEIIFAVGAIVLTYLTGSFVEKRHFRNLSRRESAARAIPVSINDEILAEHGLAETELVVGSAVIGSDYFKRAFAGLKGLFGGNISAYESLLDRARREAILRMKENARDNCIEIACCRIATSSIRPGMFEAVAYGTAVYQNPRI